MFEVHVLNNPELHKQKHTVLEGGLGSKGLMYGVLFIPECRCREEEVLLNRTGLNMTPCGVAAKYCIL